MSVADRLARRLVAVVSSLSVSAGPLVGCVPAAHAPPESPGPVVPASAEAQPKAVSPHGPVSSGSPSEAELCAAHRCPEGTYCTSGMTPRGPFAECKPLIQGAPGRSFGALALVVSQDWTEETRASPEGATRTLFGLTTDA